MRGLILVKNKSDDEDDEYTVHHHYHHSSSGGTHDSFHPKHHHAIGAIMERLEEYPTTWKPYLDSKAGAMSIVEMEYRELMESHQMGSDSRMRKELEDLAAACLHALKHM